MTTQKRNLDMPCFLFILFSLRNTKTFFFNLEKAITSLFILSTIMSINLKLNYNKKYIWYEIFLL